MDAKKLSPSTANPRDQRQGQNAVMSRSGEAVLSIDPRQALPADPASAARVRPGALSHHVSLSRDENVWLPLKGDMLLQYLHQI
jgi:hypothetical protein